MSSLIDEVARLKKLEEQQKNDDWAERMNARTRFCSESMEIMPAMIEVLSGFRPGDTHVLDVIATFFEIPRDGMTTESYQKWLDWATVLRRMAEMCKRMEEET
jgi:hypothetical protein